MPRSTWLSQPIERPSFSAASLSVSPRALRSARMSCASMWCSLICGALAVATAGMKIS